MIDAKGYAIRYGSSCMQVVAWPFPRGLLGRMVGFDMEDIDAAVRKGCGGLHVARMAHAYTVEDRIATAALCGLTQVTFHRIAASAQVRRRS